MLTRLKNVGTATLVAMITMASAELGTRVPETTGASRIFRGPSTDKPSKEKKIRKKATEGVSRPLRKPPSPSQYSDEPLFIAKKTARKALVKAAKAAKKSVADYHGPERAADAAALQNWLRKKTELQQAGHGGKEEDEAPTSSSSSSVLAIAAPPRDPTVAESQETAKTTSSKKRKLQVRAEKTYAQAAACVRDLKNAQRKGDVQMGGGGT
jgi:hypothetical protein